MGLVVGLREDWRCAACVHGPLGLVCPLQASPPPAPLWLLCQGPTAASCGRGPQPRMGLSCCAVSPTRGTVGHLLPAYLWADLVLSSQSTYSQVGWFPLHSTWASQMEDHASMLWGGSACALGHVIGWKDGYRVEGNPHVRTQPLSSQHHSSPDMSRALWLVPSCINRGSTLWGGSAAAFFGSTRASTGRQCMGRRPGPVSVPDVRVLPGAFLSPAVQAPRGWPLTLTRW